MGPNLQQRHKDFLNAGYLGERQKAWNPKNTWRLSSFHSEILRDFWWMLWQAMFDDTGGYPLVM